MPGCASALGRAAGIEEGDRLVECELRQMRVPVDDKLATRKQRGQTCSSAGARAGVVDDPDPVPGDIDDALCRQERSEFGVVHVPVDCLDRCEALELVEYLRGGEVAGVEDQVGPVEL